MSWYGMVNGVVGCAVHSALDYIDDIDIDMIECDGKVLTHNSI